MELYHGTQVQNIEQLKPFATRGNAISKPVICFTPNDCMALLYIWNRSYKWVTFSETPNGKVVFTEHYENMLYDFYNKVSGSIYECDGDTPEITPTHMKGVYTSEVPIPVEKETKINNVYDEILKQELMGNLVIQRYHQLSFDDKDEIFKLTVRAIHMQRFADPVRACTETRAGSFCSNAFPPSVGHCF